MLQAITPPYAETGSQARASFQHLQDSHVKASHHALLMLDITYVCIGELIEEAQVKHHYPEVIIRYFACRQFIEQFVLITIKDTF